MSLRGAMGPVMTVIEAATWLHEHLPNMQSYFDPPKTLEELHGAASESKRGYDIHHIVEQGPAERDGFPRSVIDAPENLVRIPRYKHCRSIHGTRHETTNMAASRRGHICEERAGTNGSESDLTP